MAVIRAGQQGSQSTRAQRLSRADQRQVRQAASAFAAVRRFAIINQAGERKVINLSNLPPPRALFYNLPPFIRNLPVVQTQV